MLNTAVLAAGVCAVGVLASPGDQRTNGADGPNAANAEAGVLFNALQLTSRDEFIKAGEAYFSADGRRIIFQAVPVPPEGERASDHYSMYVAELIYEGGSPFSNGPLGEIVGLGPSTLVSPGGSANTCGWFHPNDPDLILYGSTFVPPSEENVPGYQRDSGRYRWAFPTEMEIVTQRIERAESSEDRAPEYDTSRPFQPNATPRRSGGHELRVVGEPQLLFEKPGYDAEGSYSPDGRQVLYANVNMLRSAFLGRADADLFVYDTETHEHRPLIEADGYDGGPFFGPPDEQGRARWITYRSDREGNNLLQIFIAELAYDDSSDPMKITGTRREVQLTDNGHVNWCPWWDNDGRFLVYATSEVGHFDYEVFAVPAVDGDHDPIVTDPKTATTVRITDAAGFDGLPVFSPDGRYMMWTSQRGGAVDGEDRASSQLWIARVDRDAIAERLGITE